MTGVNNGFNRGRKKYIAKYEEKYGKLDEEGKKHVLKYRNYLNEEELDKMLEEWVGK